MRKLLLLMPLFCLAATYPVVNVQHGQYLYPGQHSYTLTATNFPVGITATNLDGYMFESNIAGVVRWQFNRNVIGFCTNAVTQINLFTTNGSGNGYALTVQLTFYTNATSGTVSATPFYFTNNVVTGVPISTTNITSLLVTNALPSGVTNANVVLGSVTVIKNNVVGAVGSLWILGGRVHFQN